MKSIKIKLNQLNPSKHQKLLDILKVLSSISKEYLPVRQKELETKEFKPFKEHYQYFRTKYPQVNSGIIQSHLRQQDSMIKSVISWCKKKHKLVTFPDNPMMSIPLRNDMFHFEYNSRTKTFDAWIKFLRMYFPLSLCNYHLKSLKDMESVKDSSICQDKSGQLYLRLCFESKTKPTNAVKSMGIDLGIVHPIVCSDGHMIGSGKYIKHKKLEFGKKRAKHQKSKETITLKQSRWTNDLNHKLSRQLVDYCISQEIGVLSLENLKGSQLSNRKFRRYTWAFKDLLAKITYKAQYAGLKVVSVDPRYTSQTCHVCGRKEKSNRQTQSRFHCDNCSLTVNADINAARNILSLSAQNGLPMNPSTSKASISETQPSLVVG